MIVREANSKDIVNALYAVFGNYGKIIYVDDPKSISFKGCAFIEFNDGTKSHLTDEEIRYLMTTNVKIKNEKEFRRFLVACKL
jgi:hypothetical protein